MVVYVILFVTPGCASPIKRFTQRSVTLISILLSPAFKAPVISTRKGCFQTMPSDFPFTMTSARFATSPKSNHIRSSSTFTDRKFDLNSGDHDASALIVFVYVAVPEKYFM